MCQYIVGLTKYWRLKRFHSSTVSCTDTVLLIAKKCTTATPCTVGVTQTRKFGDSVFFRDLVPPTFCTSVDALPPPLACSPTHLFTLDFTSPHHYRVPTSLVSTFFSDFKVISLSTRSLVGLLISSCLDALPVPLESRITSPTHRTLYSTCPSLVMSS